MPKEIPKRVSIKYSVDLAEVPDRVNIMLTELANSFGGIAKHTREASQAATSDLSACLVGMRDLNSILQKAQIRVADLTEILLGYVDILQDVAEVKAQVEKESPEPAKKKPKKKKTNKKKQTEKEE